MRDSGDYSHKTEHNLIRALENISPGDHGESSCAPENPVVSPKQFDPKDSSRIAANLLILAENVAVAKQRSPIGSEDMLGLL